MQVGRCCRCSQTVLRAVTIKGIDITDGTTIWEYGPGSFWRHHYGLDAISGLVPNLAATLNTYFLAAKTGSTYVLRDPRLAGALQANGVEALTLTKLDSTDGTVIESAVMEGVFASSIGTESATGFNMNITEAAALSGGDYVIIGERFPTIEWVDYTVDDATKSYVLHAHNWQAGSIRIKTATSDETITLAYNASAAAVETAFEATADCVSATATGGPWPHAKIEIEVVWSVATGDILKMNTDDTYLVGGTTNRSVRGSATTYNTGTALIQNSVGWQFGLGSGVSAPKLIAQAGLVPVNTDHPALRILELVAADNDAVVLRPVITSSTNCKTLEAWTVGGTWAQIWAKYTNTVMTFGSIAFLHVENDTAAVTFKRQSFTGGNRCAATVAVTTGTVTELDSDRVHTDATHNENSAAMKCSDGDAATYTWSLYERFFQSTHFGNLNWWYHLWADEVQSDGTSLLLGLGIFDGIYGIDTANLYGAAGASVTSIQYAWPPTTPTNLSGSNAKGWLWTFQTQPHEHADTGTEFRFRFQGGSASNPPRFSDWLDWHATEAEIETAILAGIGENTEGVLSSVQVYPLGAPTLDVVNDVSWLEVGLDILFAGAVNPTGLGLGFLTGSVYYGFGRITVEIRNHTYDTAAGIAAWEVASGDPLWSRPFGEKGAATVVHPTYCWLRGSLLYAAGPLVDNELP